LFLLKNYRAENNALLFGYVIFIMDKLHAKAWFSSTSYIKHLAVSGLSSVSARIKSSCNLTGKCFEMPNVSYTQTVMLHPKRDDRVENLKVKLKI
jgi:hypothetical protein